MLDLWLWVASPAASLAADLIGLAALLRANRHRDGNGKASSIRIASSVLAPGALYTFAVLVLGNFFFRQPVSDTIRDGFGDARMAWLLLGVCLDLLWRTYALFDPE